MSTSTKLLGCCEVCFHSSTAHCIDPVGKAACSICDCSSYQPSQVYTAGTSTIEDWIQELSRCHEIALKLDSRNPEAPGAFTGTVSERLARHLLEAQPCCDPANDAAHRYWQEEIDRVLTHERDSIEQILTTHIRAFENDAHTLTGAAILTQLKLVRHAIRLRREVKCTCGSGAHPRRCKQHPYGYDQHVAELNKLTAIEEEQEWFLSLIDELDGGEDNADYLRDLVTRRMKRSS
jgi:hypothetical protein